jgi:hypothetical protein
LEGGFGSFWNQRGNRGLKGCGQNLFYSAGCSSLSVQQGKLIRH